MTASIKKIGINQILNYCENPRHEIAQTEKETLTKLFNTVGTHHMLNLAEDINKNGLLGNQHIVVVYSEKLKKYIVYDGNRRIAVIKLLLAPDKYEFLGKNVTEKIKKITQNGVNESLKRIDCYVTDEEEALQIMEKIHSGEDHGRGVKQWTSREKENFKVRRNKNKSMQYLIDQYTKKYFDGLDITSILPFTTLQRIFNNPEIKKKIGLDISNENSFTKERVNVVVQISKWIQEDAKSKGIAVTRLYNKSEDIKENILPWIDENFSGKSLNEKTIEDLEKLDNTESEKLLIEKETENTENIQKNSTVVMNTDPKEDHDSTKETAKVVSEKTETKGITNAPQSKKIKGGPDNYPYFFQGLDFSKLNPNDQASHGVSLICKEIKRFSDKKLVEEFPISAAYLTRAIIEHSILYYSKTHKVQGTQKCIYDQLNTRSLSNIIECYIKQLPNYIVDANIRNYFESLFKEYKKTIDPLNWVVHRPEEFCISPQTLIALPRRGLLTLINYFLS